MKKQILKVLSVLMAACSLFCFVGCGPKDVNKAGEVVLRFSTWDGGEALLQITDLVNKFNAEHQGKIEVELEYVPDQYATKMLSQINSKTAPDIMQIGDEDVVRFAKKGYFEPLEPIIDSDPLFNTDIYYENILNVGRVDGTLYTLPAGFTNVAVYYNKDMFDEAGVPYPDGSWTWQEFVETAKKLNKTENGKLVQWGASTFGGWIRLMLPLLDAFGGSVQSPDGKNFVGYMDSEETIEAMTYYRSWFYGEENICPTPQDQNQFYGMDLFQTKKVAMYVHGIWFLDTYKNTPGLNFATAKLPSGENGESNTQAWGGYGIYSRSKHKQEAYTFLKYLAGEEGIRAQASHHMPAIKSAAEELGWNTDEHYKGFLDGIDYVKPHPDLANYFFVSTGLRALQPVVDKLMQPNEFDLKKDLEEAAKAAEDYLDREKAKERY